MKASGIIFFHQLELGSMKLFRMNRSCWMELCHILQLLIFVVIISVVLSWLPLCDGARLQWPVTKCYPGASCLPSISHTQFQFFTPTLSLKTRLYLLVFHLAGFPFKRFFVFLHIDPSNLRILSQIFRAFLERFKFFLGICCYDVL